MFIKCKNKPILNIGLLRRNGYKIFYFNGLDIQIFLAWFLITGYCFDVIKKYQKRQLLKKMNGDNS